MDPSRIESYLRSACCALDFDIGELWSARKMPDQKPELKFIQLYTSPTYEDFHSLLIQPEQGAKDEEKHRFSPVICRGVCEGGQIVWANTRISQGLTGRSELPLNTAVGVPICSIGHDTYILVLFAVEIILMTPQAVEYLSTVSRAVTEGSSTFLSPSFTHAATISKAKTEDFVGTWDIGELIRKYSSEVEFHLLPIGKLQKYFDCNEILLFCDFFTDFKTRRDGRFTVKQLESLRDSYRSNRLRSDSVSTLNSKTWDHIPGGTQSLPPSQSQTDIQVKEEPTNPFADHPGVYIVDLSTMEGHNDVGYPLEDHQSPKNNHEKAELVTEEKEEHNLQLMKSGENEEGAQNNSVLHIYAQMTYKLSQSRIHEFMISILGMTVFESSELWLVSDRESELFLVAGVYRNANMQNWIGFNENIRLSIGTSGPGRIVATSNSHWEMNYADVCEDSDPRKAAAKQYQVNTSFGVPIPGMRGSCGALMFYSTKANFAAEPLLILLVERAVQLITTSNLENNSNDNLPHEQTASTLNRWLQDDNHSVSGTTIQTTASTSQPHTTYDVMLQSGLMPNHNLNQADFQERLTMIRNMVNNKEPSLPYPPQLFPHQQPSLPPMVMIPPQHLDANDPEVSAAYALANIGKVHWQNFLEGSNNGVNMDGGYGGLKLESNKVLAMYEDQLGAGNSSSSSLPKCKAEDCNACVENATVSYCINHRHMRRCQKEGCNKCAQGATKYCIAHGGGRRCTFPGCFKGARDKFFCAAHGGGKRCSFEGCTKSAVGGSNLCTAHGGGKRCQYPGCTKSSQSSTKYCVRHGGGRTCSYPDCNKVARGKTEFCASHGGGIRCKLKGCNRLSVSSQQLCRTHLQQLHGGDDKEEDSSDDGRTNEVGEESTSLRSGGSNEEIQPAKKQKIE